MSSREKRKILAAKIVLAILMVVSFSILISDSPTSLSTDFFQLSGILSIFFAYTNLLHVKSELVELFEPPYIYVGYEFIVVALIINAVAWII